VHSGRIFTVEEFNAKAGNRYIPMLGQQSKKKKHSTLAQFLYALRILCSKDLVCFHSFSEIDNNLDPLQTSELTYTIHCLPADYSYIWYMKRSLLSARK